MSTRKLFERKRTLPSLIYLMLLFLLINIKKYSLKTTPAETLKSQYKKTRRKFEIAQQFLNTSKSVECNPVTWGKSETHHQGRSKDWQNVTTK